MQWLMTLYVAALFFVLTPGILVSLPPGGKKMTVALTHAVVFAVVYQLTHKMVWRALYEGFEAAGATTQAMMCTTDKDCMAPMKCKANKCTA